MDKPKILILNASAIYGGGEYYCLQLANELYNKGYTIIVGSNNNSPLFQKCISSGISTNHIDFPEKGTKGLRENVKRIRQVIKEHNINIVHTNTNYDRTAGAFAARGTAAKHVTSLHSLESISHNITHYIRNRFFTDHFIADGKKIRNLVIKKNKIPETKVSIIYNGINPDEMKHDEVLRAKIRREFGIKDNEIIIGNVGRMVRFKGQKYLLSALKIILENFADVKLMITGDGELMNSFKEQASSLGINDKIIFTGFRDDLRAVYSAFDIYVQPSIEGGGELLPFSVLYAMAQKLPVIATNTGDIPQMVIDSKTGFVTGEKSPIQISNKCLELINDSKKRQSFGQKGYELLNEKFTLGKMVNETEKIYQKTSKNG